MESPLCAPNDAEFRLIETFRLNPDGDLARHLGRMAQSAQALGLRFDLDTAQEAVAQARGAGPLRCRLTMDRGGAFHVTTAPLGAPSDLWRVALHPERLRSDDPWLAHKTTVRALYDRARADLPAGVEEWIFANERQEVCEGAITNVFVGQDNGPLLTPSLSCGVLPGILRAGLIAQGAAVEATLSPQDLSDAPAIWVGNSLRGLIRAQLVSALP